MALSAAQINSIYAALFGPANLPSAAQLTTWEALDAAQGDNAVLLGIVNSPLSLQFDYSAVQLIEFVQGTVPNAVQLQGWVAYLEAGNSLSSMVNAFAGSSNFQANFNNGQPVANVNAPVNTTIATNIIFQALGTIPSQAQVAAWVNTGISIAQMVTEFALGDQYSARTASFVQNYLVTVAAHAAGLPGAAAPSGTLFGIPALITITDNTATNIPPEETTAGNTVTFTVTGVGVSTGTQETWSLGGTALSEVVGPTSGTLTFNAAGTATITVATGFNNIASGTLTLSLTSITGVTPDTVTIIAPAVQHFTATVGEVLPGGPINTVFEGTVDTQVVGNNTLSNVVDVAQGNPLFHNTEWITINSTAVAPLGLNSEIIVPASTGVQEFKFTNNDNFIGGPTQIDGSMMQNVTEITSFGSASNTNIFNLQNAITEINISESDAVGQAFLGVIMVNSTTPGFAQTVNLTNAGALLLEDETTNGTDVVGEFDINSLAGTNALFIDGTSVATTIRVTDAGTASVTSITSDDATAALTLVDMTGTSGTVTISGIEAAAGNTLAINEGSGHDTEHVTVQTGATLNVTGTSTTSANGSSFTEVFFTGSNLGNETLLQVVNDTQSNDNPDTLDVDNNHNQFSGAFSSVTATFGNGNDNASIEVGQASNVNVSMGNGNDNVTVDTWESTAPGGSGSTVNVTLGSGVNNVAVNTNHGANPDNGSQVTIVTNQAASSNNQTIGVNVGFSATVDIDTLGIGINAITVTSQDLTATITVGNGTDNISVNDQHANNPGITGDNVTIAGGNGANTLAVTVAGGSTVKETLGSGGNKITDTTFNGHTKITVNAGLGVSDGSDTVTVHLNSGGNNNVSVTTGTGNDSVSIDGIVVSDKINVSTGAGNDRVFVDFIGANTTLAGGADTLALVNGLWTNGDTLATTAAAFLAGGGTNVQSANITGFENLELTTQLNGSINVLWLGPLDNIVKVVLDAGYTGLGDFIAGLDPGTEVDLLAGSAGASSLFIPVNGANINHNFGETLVLNPSGGGATSFGTVMFNTAGNNWINTLHVFSENSAHVADTTLNEVILVDNQGAPGGTLDLAGNQFLSLNGTGFGLSGFTTIQNDPAGGQFTGGLTMTDLNVPVFGIGTLDAGTTGITINLPNSANDVLNLGDGNDHVTLGNGNNIVHFGNGTDTFVGGNGNNVVDIGWQNGNNYFLDIAHGGGVDNLSFGTGINLVSLSAADTAASNGSGTVITFAAHSAPSDDVVNFLSIYNSGYNTPDVINGFNPAVDALNVVAIDGGHANVNFYVASTSAGVLATVATDAALHFDIVYDNTNGEVYIDTNGSHSLTAGSGDMQIDVVGATGLSLLQLEHMFAI